MGVQTAGRPLTQRPSQHARLLQHEVLSVENCRPASKTFLLAHHETLEEDTAHQQTGATAEDHSPPILPTPSQGKEANAMCFGVVLSKCKHCTGPKERREKNVRTA